MSDYLQAIQLNPQAAAPYACRAELYAKQEDVEKALADYDQAVALGTEDVDVYVGRGEIYMTRNVLDKAKADFSEAIRLAPKQARPYAMRGWVHWKQDDLDKAITDLNEAVRIEPGMDTAHHLRAEILARQHRYEDAIGAYTVAIDHSYEPGELHRQRGKLRRKVGQYREALADFDAAIKLSSTDTDAWIEKAALLATCSDAKVGNSREAIECGKQACLLTGWSDPRPLQALASAYAEAGEFDDAIKQQDEAIKLLDADKSAAAKATLANYKDHKSADGLPSLKLLDHRPSEAGKPPQFDRR